MKVIYILHYTTTTQGSSKSFLAMLRGLMAKGVHPTVVLPDNDGIYGMLFETGIETIVLNYRPHTFPNGMNTLCDYLLYIPRLVGRLYLNRRASAQLTEILKRLRPDIIHTNVSVINIGYNAARALHIPHIYHIREYGDKDFGLHYIPSHRRLEHELDQAGSYSICITGDIQHHHHQDGKQTSRVIYNGIKDKQDTIPTQHGRDYFFFAGRIEPAKGLDLLIEAYTLYARQAAHVMPLFVAGGSLNPEYAESMKELARDNGIDNHISWLGERTDINSLMNGAAATIIPSRFEGFGRVMPEAMFNGCLVIGRNTGGTKEQMDNGVNITGGEIALRFNTPDELASRLLDVSTGSQDCFDAYRDRAFRAVNTLYTTEAHADGVYNMYKEILQCTDTIGDVNIVGTNSVVPKNIPAYSVAACVPARIVKQV